MINNAAPLKRAPANQSLSAGGGEDEVKHHACRNAGGTRFHLPCVKMLVTKESAREAHVLKLKRDQPSRTAVLRFLCQQVSSSAGGKGHTW